MIAYPFRTSATITPHDSNDQGLGGGCAALYIGGAGDLAVTMQGGGNQTFKAVPVGTLIHLNVTRVLATGTVATNIVALWN